MKQESFLFVSWTASARPFVDPSTRYRCFNPCQELVRRGSRGQVVSQALFQENLSSYEQYDTYVFHRPLLTDGLGTFLINNLRSKRLIADFDDLIFDVPQADLTPMVRVRGGSSSSIRHYVAGTAEATRLFPFATVSTSPLQKKLETAFPKISISISHNAVDPGYIGICKLIRKGTRHRVREYDFGYFSGTATHDADFAMIANPLKAAFESKPFARLLIVGPVPIPDALKPYAQRIDIKPIVKFHELPYLKAKCEAVLAPLEYNTFTECKSGIKFFEAAILGCRVIATPIPDISRFNSPLLVKCHTNEEWERALSFSDQIEPSVREHAATEIEAAVSISRSQIGVFSNSVRLM